MKYYPFGATRSGSVPTDIKFTGQRMDDHGLYYFNARYYDPQTGRFISVGPATYYIALPYIDTLYMDVFHASVVTMHYDAFGVPHQSQPQSQGQEDQSSRGSTSDASCQATTNSSTKCVSD